MLFELDRAALGTQRGQKWSRGRLNGRVRGISLSSPRRWWRGESGAGALRSEHPLRVSMRARRGSTRVVLPRQRSSAGAILPTCCYFAPSSCLTSSHPSFFFFLFFFLARSWLGAEAMRGVKRDGAPPRSASLRAPWIKCPRSDSKRCSVPWEEIARHRHSSTSLPQSWCFFSVASALHKCESVPLLRGARSQRSVASKKTGSSALHV